MELKLGGATSDFGLLLVLNLPPDLVARPWARRAAISVCSLSNRWSRCFNILLNISLASRAFAHPGLFLLAAKCRLVAVTNALDLTHKTQHATLHGKEKKKKEKKKRKKRKKKRETKTKKSKQKMKNT